MTHCTCRVIMNIAPRLFKLIVFFKYTQSVFDKCHDVHFDIYIAHIFTPLRQYLQS